MPPLFDLPSGPGPCCHGSGPCGDPPTPPTSVPVEVDGIGIVHLTLDGIVEPPPCGEDVPCAEEAEPELTPRERRRRERKTRRQRR